MRRILAERGKRLRKSRVKIINGYVHYSGTIDNLTMYWQGNVQVVRTINAPGRNRIKKDKCFEGSRRSAERFAQGNKLASKLNAMVEKEKKVYSLFCFLKKKAILLIKEGKTITEAEELLIDHLRDFGAMPPCTTRLSGTSPDLNAPSIFNYQLTVINNLRS